jgi:hypothetical protein
VDRLEGPRSLKHTGARRALLPAGAAFVVLLAVVGGVLLASHLSRQSSSDRQAAIARGRYDFATGSCISCHALFPISSAGGAIDLTLEGSRRTLTWLQHEIRFPTSLRPPTPAGQADDLAAFLSSLK